jgi:putative ABC transport system permease protein
VIALREITRRRTQFALIALVVTLISYLVLMINGLGVGLNELAGSALRSFDADAIAYSSNAGLSVIRSELSQETVETIAATEGVEESASIGYVAANYVSGDGEINSAAFLGFDPGTIGEPAVTSGNGLGDGDTYGMLADSSFLKASGLDVGDTVEVTIRLSTQKFTIVGEIDEGAFFFQPAVYILRTTWQQLKYGDVEERPVASVVLVKGDGLAGATGEGFEIVSKTTAFANIEGVQGQQTTVSALRLFGYVIGGLVIGVFFYVLTIQKVPQIGILKAVGATSFFVFRQILIQVVLLALAGVVIAVPLAALTEELLSRLPEAVPIRFTTGTFITTSLALLATAIIGAAFSARRVIKVDAIIALGQQQ